MTRRETVQRVTAPTAILVGLDGALLQACKDTLHAASLRVLAVGHIAAACERIPVVMPQLVVVRTVLATVEAERLHDSCVAVGADMVRVAPDMDPAALEKALKSAAGVARIKALRID